MIFGMWSLATPLWSTPDAQQHELTAWAFGHGDLNPEQTDQEANSVNSNAIVMVPKGIADSAETTSCYTGSSRSRV